MAGLRRIIFPSKFMAPPAAETHSFWGKIKREKAREVGSGVEYEEGWVDGFLSRVLREKRLGLFSAVGVVFKGRVVFCC